MSFQNYRLKSLHIAYLFFFTILITQKVFPQDNDKAISINEKYIAVAREIMEKSQYCALVTTNHLGQIHVRTMEPFAPEDNLVVWLGTNSNSRKVQEIIANPQVSLYYSDNEGGGYVTVNGIARLVDNLDDKTRFLRNECETLFPGWKDNFYSLIEITPITIELLSYKHGIIGDPETWKAPQIEFRFKIL